MKARKFELLTAGVIYFLILLGVALWVRDIPNQPDAIGFTLRHLIEMPSGGDYSHFAEAAADIAKNRWISSANDWIFNLWPPGFILLEAFIVTVLGPEAHVILVLQILAAVLFAIVLVLFYELMIKFMARKIAFVLPLLIFAFPLARVFLLQPTGVILGETFAVGFFLISVFLVIFSVMRNKIRYAVYAGLCLALSAYFRSQFEIILLAMTGWGVLFIIAITLTFLRKSIDPKFVAPIVKTIAIVLLTSHAVTAPWRAYHWIYQDNPSWVQTSDLVFANSVLTSEQLNNKGGEFVVAGGGNLVCRIVSTTCGDTTNAKSLFIKTFISHPIEWYSLKFGVIGAYWFSSIDFKKNSPSMGTSRDVTGNGLFLISLIALTGLLLTRKVRSHGSWILLVWVNASLFSAYMLIFTVVHFEVRYFFFPKIVGLVMFLIVAGLYFRPMKKIDALNDVTAK